MEKLNGTILISEFMGRKIVYSGGEHILVSVGNTPIGNVLHHTDYDTSWDSLMPVVEKINKSEAVNLRGVGVWISHGKCSIGINEYESITGFESYQTPLIDIVWETVASFIEWLNTQNRSHII